MNKTTLEGWIVDLIGQPSAKTFWHVSKVRILQPLTVPRFSLEVVQWRSTSNLNVVLVHERSSIVSLQISEMAAYAPFIQRQAPLAYLSKFDTKILKYMLITCGLPYPYYSS